MITGNINNPIYCHSLIRQYNQSQDNKIVLAMKLEPLYAAKARKRQSQAGKVFGKGKDSISSNELNLSEGQARDQAAKARKRQEAGVTLSSNELKGQSRDQAAKARQRQVQAGELFGKGKDSLSSNELNLSEGQARDQAARAVGLTPTTYHRAKTVLKEAQEEELELFKKDKVKPYTICDSNSGVTIKTESLGVLVQGMPQW